MNQHKLIAIAIAILINCVIIGAFVAWSSNAVANASPKPANTDKAITLAPIDVYPSAAELRALSHSR